MPYGPDDDQPVQMPWVFSFSLDPGHGANLTFSSAAGYEQALIIYRASTWEQMIEKGTYTPLRNLDPAVLPTNNGAAPEQYYVTGWYKGYKPHNNGGWCQSQFRATTPDGSTTIVGFDDPGVDKTDHDFNDIVVTIKRT